MIINVHGDALRLLDHFVYYATGEHSHRIADAMWYDPDGFLFRARLLKKAFDDAMDDGKSEPYNSADNTFSRLQDKL